MPFFREGYKIKISIHALLAESDCFLLNQQSQVQHFYPRSPCGERLTYTRETVKQMEFLSTLSLRRATGKTCTGMS